MNSVHIRIPRGSASANQKLSKARAQSCIDYLVKEKGLPADRFIPKGYGENVPTTYYETDSLTGDTTLTQVLKESYINQYKKSDKDKFEMLHQLNRRTECSIISMDYVPKEPDPAPTPEGGEGTEN